MRVVTFKLYEAGRGCVIPICLSISNDLDKPELYKRKVNEP